MSTSSQPPPVPPQRPLPVQPVEYQTPQTARAMSDRKVISDTVTGLNLRVSDNLLQIICALVCAMIGWGIGTGRFGGAGGIVVGVIGFFVGVLLAGVYIALYRGIRHMTRKDR